jgi:ribosome-binding protein aMBF1 (putative translation factor)
VPFFKPSPQALPEPFESSPRKAAILCRFDHFPLDSLPEPSNHLPSTERSPITGKGDTDLSGKAEQQAAVDFGRNLHQHREAAGLTQKELATRGGLPCAQISRWEHGRRLPRKENLRKLAKALGVPMKTLLPPAAKTPTPSRRRPGR